jgi:hypothetical protein
LTQPTLSAGGLPASVLFSGFYPGSIGIYQINFVVPPGIPPGNQPFTLSIGGFTSQTVTLPIGTRQTITFGSLANQPFGTVPFTVSATASSGLPVSFASTTSAICTVSGTTVTLVAVGTCTIQATQAGNATYAAATPVNQSFQVMQASQTITFNALANQLLGTPPFVVSATASSGLPVSFASTTPAICTVLGAAVTLVSAGPCTIQATQAGNSNYAAALPVNQSFQVTPPCSYSLSPTGQAFASGGGLGSFTITTTPACGWSLGFSATWITAVSPAASPGGGSIRGAGTRAITFAVASNSGAARAGSISVGGQSFNIDQAALSCSYSIGPSFSSLLDTGGSVSVSVSATEGCRWTAVSNVSWVTVHSGGSGSGGGVVVLTVAANTGSSRSGTATIAGQTFSITQGAGACGALDVTSQVRVYQSGLSWIPFSTYEFSESITVYTSESNLYLVLLGLPNHQPYPYGTGIFGNQLITTCFSSQGDYMIPLPTPISGQTGVPMVLFSQSLSDSLEYSVKILSGRPSH